MKILGIYGFSYNPACALVIDGKIVSFIEEERLINFKGAHFMFPGASVKWCLDQSKLTLNDIDYIAWGWNNLSYRFKIPFFYLKKYFKYSLFRSGKGNINNVISLINNNQPSFIKQKIKDELRRVGLSGPLPPIEFIDHHEAHVASTYCLSGFNKASIVVIDGSGETLCTSIWRAENNEYKLFSSYEIPNSLGWFYAGLTDYLGFIPYRDEGKIMGLAPYGEYSSEFDEKLDKIINISSNNYFIDPSYLLLGNHESGKHYSDKLVSLLGSPRYYGEPLNKRTMDLAFAVQNKLEKAIINIIKTATDNGNIRNICIAGGVGLNCKMNGVIRESSFVDKIFVQPASNDAGVALGAAIVLSNQLSEWNNYKLKSTFLGPSFSDDFIKNQLDICGANYSIPNDISHNIAQAISEGKIIGHFNGSMEFGSRALGNRSILANPSDPKMKNKVNEQVKYREPWRPFCPSLIAESMNDYLDDADDAEFMIVAYQAKKGVKNLLPSVVHVDNSVRPQTVEKDVNPRYWNIMNELKSLTGHPVVLNTSFNLRGRPIISNPMDAISCFFSNGLDVLVLNNYWIEKK